MNQSKEMTKLAITALEDKKANDIRVIDIAGVSVIADYFVIASGSNTNQVQAMADSVREALGRAGHEPRQVEGYGSANWILMDYNDIIVHIFSDESRTFYDLERIWRDGKEVSVGEFETEDCTEVTSIFL
uniref:ribosome silencing factor n=1 Tax=Coprococcus catus TaxID=116085 RepID=UPI0022E0548A|nr:ribosome silencing factor [Coprococcus catus]